MKAIEGKTLTRFLEIAGTKLSGDWVILGGSVLPLLGVFHRVTLDIDVAGPKKSSQDDILILMEIAQELGLPVEAINQAAGYFLFKVPNWDKQLVLLHKGEKAAFFRPNVNLFLELKIGRMDQSDLEDCIHFLEFAKQTNEAVDSKRISILIRKRLSGNNDKERKARLKRLLGLIGDR